MSVTLEDADGYFADHLDREFWTGLDASTRAAALKMAQNDVLARLGAAALDGEDIMQFCAVCEQAVYLARNYTEINTGKIMTSEGLEGISNSYAAIDAVDFGFSPRAAKFLAGGNSRSRCGSVSLGRG